MRRYGASVHAARSPIWRAPPSGRALRENEENRNECEPSTKHLQGFFRARILRGIIFSREFFFQYEKYKNENETEKRRLKRKKREITKIKEKERIREREGRGEERWNFSETNKSSCHRLFNLFIVTSSSSSFRRRVHSATHGGARAMGQEEGAPFPQVCVLARTRRRPDDDADRSS